MTKVLSIVSLIALPFQKVCGNCHVIDVIISPIGGGHCNACCSKSMVQKLSFIYSSIAPNDEFVLLTINSKWFEIIVHLKKIEFLNLLRPKQIQLFISIHIHGKFSLLTTSALIDFQEVIH
jgi:hypothetical protein